MLALAGLVGGCAELASRAEFRDAGSPPDTGTVDMGTADTGALDTGLVDAMPDAPPDTADGAVADAGLGCPPVDERELVALPTSIPSDTTLTCDNLYRLTGRTYVTDGAVLTVEPGVVVQAGSSEGLVITSGARIRAEGTAAEPIVFTSSVDEPDREEGDWVGLTLVGDAPIDSGSDTVSGLGSRSRYGGDDPTHDCGTLRYVRIDYAGDDPSSGINLPGLGLYGCGTDTVVDYVHVKRADDDGVRVCGGTVNLSHVIVTGAVEDGLDWEDGWVGRLQFLVVQQHDRFSLASAIDGEGSGSAPVLFNVTLIGAPSGVRPAILLQGGSAGRIENAIVTGFEIEAIDVGDAGSAAHAMTDPVGLEVAHSIFFAIGATGTIFFVDESATDDDGGFIETDYFMHPDRANRFDVDPLMSVLARRVSRPDFKPLAGTPALTGGRVPLPIFFDTSANFVGAIDPASDEDWTHGWTDYTVDGFFGF